MSTTTQTDEQVAEHIAAMEADLERRWTGQLQLPTRGSALDHWIREHEKTASA